MESSPEHKPLLNRQLFSKPIVRFPVWIPFAVVFLISLLEITANSIHWSSISLLSAACFIFASTALLINHLNLKSVSSRVTYLFISTFICLITILTLATHLTIYITGKEPAISGLPLFHPIISPDYRLPFLSSLSFLLTGIILFLYYRRTSRNSAIAHFIVLIISLIVYFTIVSYILGINKVTRFSEIPGSVFSGLALWGLCITILLMRPDTWLMRFYNVNDTGGHISRMLIIPAILLPVTIGWIRLHGEKSNLFSYEEGVIIASTLYTIIFILLTWIITIYVRRIDRKRASSELALVASERRYRNHASRLEAISNILNSTFSLPDENAVGSKCLEIAQNLTCCDSGFIALLSNRKLFKLALNNPSGTCNLLKNAGHENSGYGFSPHGIFGQVLNERKSLITNTPTGIMSFLPEGHPSFNSLLGVPLIHNDKTIGIIVLANAIGGFSKTDQETIELAAPFIGAAIISKQAEKALKISEEKFRNLVKYAPTVIFEMDMRGQKFINVNNTGYEILGYSSEELYSIKPADLLDDKSKIQFKELIRQKLNGEIADETLEYNVRKKNGEWLIVLVNVGKIFYYDEAEPKILVIAYDITIRKKMEKNLEESEKKFRELVKYAPTAIYEVDFIRKKFLTINDAMCLLSGYSREELLSKNIFDLLDDESKSELRERITKVHAGETPSDQVEYKVIRKDGQIVFATLNMRFLFDEAGKPVGALVVGHDITERKKAQQAVTKSELKLKENITKLQKIEKELISTNLKYDELLTNARSIIVKIDTEGKCNYINEYGTHFFNFKNEEITGRPLTETIVPEKESTGRDLRKMVERIRSDPDRYSVNINENQKKNGERVWIEWHNKATYDKNSKRTGHIAIGIDITARKRFEEDLKESKAKLLSVLNATQESIYMLDVNGVITMSNSTGLKRLNKLSENDAIGHQLSELIPPYVAGHRMEKVEEVIRTCKPIKFDDSHENRNFTHNYFPVFKDNKVSAVVIYSRDITKRKRAEAKLRDNEAKLKELVDTKDKFFNIVAHDLKNPFTSMLGSTELLLDNINDLDKKSIHELSSILYDSAKSGYAILQNLLDWSRSQTGLLKINNEKINLKKLIDENISALQLALSKKDIKIQSMVLDDILICADKNMINTILRNLLSNAVKFTHRAGQVIISTEVLTDKIIVSVKDSGVGIAEERIDALFRLETKHFMPGTENEQGTGLGLKLTKEFVEKLGGSIWVESRQGEGSDFKFTIPRSFNDLV